MLSVSWRAGLKLLVYKEFSKVNGTEDRVGGTYSPQAVSERVANIEMFLFDLYAIKEQLWHG